MKIAFLLWLLLAPVAYQIAEYIESKNQEVRADIEELDTAQLGRKTLLAFYLLVATLLFFTT